MAIVDVIRDQRGYCCDSLIDMLILELFAHVYYCLISLYRCSPFIQAVGDSEEPINIELTNLRFTKHITDISFSCPVYIVIT